MPTLPSKDAVSFHDAIAGRWDAYYDDPRFAVRFRVLDELLRGQDLRGQQWLDAGCGTGVLSRWLAANKGCSVHGIDGSESMVRNAKPAQGVTFSHVRDVRETGLEDASVEGVLCSSVLEYVDEPGAALREFHRVLKPDGQLLVSVPHNAALIRLPLLLAHWVTKPLGRRRLAAYLDHSRHSYSKQSFSTLLQESGFEVARAIGFGTLTLPFGVEIHGGGTLLFFASRRLPAPRPAVQSGAR